MMNVTNKAINLDIGNLAQPGMENVPVGAQADDVKNVAQGSVLRGKGVTVVSSMDLAKLLAQLGIETGDQRRDLQQVSLSGALTMMLGAFKVDDERQQKALDDIAGCEKKIKELKDEKAAIEAGIETDPTIIAIKIEIDKINQMIKSMEMTPEEREAALRQKEKLEKDLAAKVQEKSAAKQERINEIDAAIKRLTDQEAVLFGLLDSSSTMLIFSALSALAALARRELAQNPDDKGGLLLLDGVEQLARRLGEVRPEDARRGAALIDEISRKRAETQYA